MIGLLTAVVLFNTVAFLTNHKLTKSQIVQLWTFTSALQLLTDAFVGKKYHGYWYFSGQIEWSSILIETVLIPPVNMLFLNGYPYTKTLTKRLLYVLYWNVAITLYECVAILPEPWGYFHYGWWKTLYSFLVNPFLLFCVLKFYQWIKKLENES